MTLEQEHGLWALQWFPVLFDVLTVVMLAAGCLLLWLGLRPAKEVTRTATQTADHEPHARPASEVASQEPAKLSEVYRADSLALSDDSPGADADPGPHMAIDHNSLDQNSYAGRVALAMRKSRAPSGGL
jgi:hypothetical protein